MRVLIVMLWFTALCAGGIWGREYFLYDTQKNQLAFMPANGSEFTRKMVLYKQPDLIFPTGDDDHYLAVLNPEPAQKGGTPAKSGLLFLFSLTTGRIEDVVEIGYAPFQWIRSQNGSHFFWVARATPDAAELDLCHYHAGEIKFEKISNCGNTVRDLQLSMDGHSLYLLAESEPKKTPRFHVYQTGPLELQNRIELGKNPEKLFVLSNQRVAVLETGAEGTIKLVDPGKAVVAAECRFKPTRTNWQWFESERVLVVVAADKTVPGKRDRSYKVTADGFRYHEIPSGWLDVDYLPDLDRLYILTKKDLEMIDYKNSSMGTFRTEGPNNEPSNYCFYRLQPRLAVLHCIKNGYVKFFNLETNKVLKKVKCGRTGAKILNSLLFVSPENQTMIGVNPQKSEFMVLHQPTRDVTVLDKTFKNLGYIPVPDEPLAFYQVEKPVYQTILVTERKIYRVAPEKLSLAPIYEFKTKTENIRGSVEERRITFLTENEWVVLDAETLKVKESYQLTVDGDKGGKKEEKRYRVYGY